MSWVPFIVMIMSFTLQYQTTILTLSIALRSVCLGKMKEVSSDDTILAKNKDYSLQVVATYYVKSSCFGTGSARF